ncbi:serine hydrolase [Myxococcota bacterium]|nr:serine hydrolase [Myxococcota bacterium]MCZ7617656.1 class A beta-lactamase-related serine hydrolase [Myxococcota bacterium]
MIQTGRDDARTETGSGPTRARAGRTRRRSSVLRSLLGILALLVALPASAQQTARAGASTSGSVGTAALLSHFVKPSQGALFQRKPGMWDPAPLWSYLDPVLEDGLHDALRDLGLQGALARRKLAVTLVDITDVQNPRVAALNGDTMLYAASLPKIAVMLGVYQKAAEGRLTIDDETYHQLLRMIRRSDNGDSTTLMHKVGKDYIARVMLSPRYRLYDPLHNGGLWAGKDYAAVGAWRRDPMYNLSHGATAMQVARFYYLLQTGRLVSPQASRDMKEVLRHSASDHKFLRGIRAIRPDAIVYRKAGTWGQAHADGALIERRDGATYIAVGLADDPMGGEWLKQIIIAMDRLIDQQPSGDRVRRTHLPSRPATTASVSAGG